jgi:uncharacterized membrane protein YoaK (UPF0700 family)
MSAGASTPITGAIRRPDESSVRDVLLVALTVSTGAVDAISWLALGKVFSAFMTGNLVFLGFDAAGAAGPSAQRVLTALAAFAVGAVLAARIVAPATGSGSTWPHRVTVAIGIALVAQATFLGLWIATGTHPSSGAGDALIAMSALAMGMQTTAVFALGVRAIFTTAATATWAILMGDLSGWSQSTGERRRLAAVIVGLFTGALIGAVLVLNARSWAPVFPLTVSGSVVATAAFAFGGAQRSQRQTPVHGTPTKDPITSGRPITPGP